MEIKRIVAGHHWSVGDGSGKDVAAVGQLIMQQTSLCFREFHHTQSQQILPRVESSGGRFGGSIDSEVTNWTTRKMRPPTPRTSKWCSELSAARRTTYQRNTKGLVPSRRKRSFI